ncbi:hypothetical protein HDU76_003687 [Blyttiomyces sp. JEL0837]|nr:hypothetical protein HDU76_003687 [Blyttiomyces sp. JEL0837]
MAPINAFSVRLLQSNLKNGAGTGHVLGNKLKELKLLIGETSCPANAPANVFAVNELPRLYQSNPQIKFTTMQSDKEKERSHILLAIG